MEKKRLSIFDISSISGEDTDRFKSGTLSYAKSIDFLVMIASIENELLPKIPDIESRINIKKYVDRIKAHANYSKIIESLNGKTDLSFKEKKLLGKKRHIKNKNNTNLYIDLVNFCEEEVSNFNCTCEKFKKFQIDISECEQYHSRNCIDYDCFILPFMYLLKRIDRHCSELIYAFKQIEKILTQMDEFNILELGCGPAMSLIAMDYYNKKYNHNKLINYYGIDINPIWEPIYKEIKRISKENTNINIEGFSKKDIVQDLNFSKKYNIIVINYVISWFAENKLNRDIDKIFKNALNSIDKTKKSIIIINDVNKDFKGVNEFFKIEEILDKLGLKYYPPIKCNLEGKDTILQKYYNYWGKNNVCTSAQLIITIGGKDDN